MIKAIIFDIGKILVHEEVIEAQEKIANKYGFSADDFYKFFKKYSQYSYTGWHYNAFFKKMIEELSIKSTSKNLSDDWFRIREETSKVIDESKNMIFNLRKNYILGMLSNTTLLNEKTSVRKEVISFFDENLRIRSHEIGFKKPDKEIYELLISKLEEKKVKPEETIFIDDKIENLGPAENLGIKTIHYKDIDLLKKELKDFGVNF
jgi:putative hydrolase of the HAD superfamily